MNNPFNFLGFKQVLIAALYALIASIAGSLIAILDAGSMLTLSEFSTWIPIISTGLSIFLGSLLTIFIRKRNKFKKESNKLPPKNL